MSNTSRKIKIRVGEHRSLHLFEEEKYFPGDHSTAPGHSDRDFHFLALEEAQACYLQRTPCSKAREAFWIHALKSLDSFGLNEQGGYFTV